jgi:hypothetical protein
MAETCNSPSQPLSVEQAATAIIDLMNSRPQCPGRDEIEAILKKMTWARIDGSVVLEVRRVSALLAERERAAGKLKGAAFHAANAERARWQARLDELEAQVPNPQSSFSDLVVLAEIAHAGAEVGEDGRMAEIDEPDIFERPAARLVEAVLQFHARGQPR